MAFLRNIWRTNSRHTKLSEELVLQTTNDQETGSDENVDFCESNLNAVFTFKLKYLGSRTVEINKSQQDQITLNNGVESAISCEAVKLIMKTNRNRVQKVTISVSLKGISITDAHGNDVLKVSIYRISKCATDAIYPNVFSFISREGATLQCHAFLCAKRCIAETVALAVAHAFSTAYEAWRILPSTREFERAAVDTTNNRSDDTKLNDPKVVAPVQKNWVSFDDDNEEFDNAKTNLILI